MNKVVSLLCADAKLLAAHRIGVSTTHDIMFDTQLRTRYLVELATDGLVLNTVYQDPAS